MDTTRVPIRPGRAWLVLSQAAILVIAAVLFLQGPAEAASAKVINSGPRSSRGVALTFDDGWGASSCESIARTLRRMNATGTFFINGNHLQAQPKRWRRILKGFPVANHTRAHYDLTTKSSQAIRRQIQFNEQIHERLLKRPMIKMLRPPYGATNARVARVAGKLKYKYIVLWNRTAADTSPAASVTSIVRRTTGARPGSIILMHCARSVTAKALPKIIRHYKRRGIKLIGLDQMFGLRG